jgi:hypothetical protein
MVIRRQSVFDYQYSPSGASSPGLKSAAESPPTDIEDVVERRRINSSSDKGGFTYLLQKTSGSGPESPLSPFRLPSTGSPTCCGMPPREKCPAEDKIAG